MKDVASQAQDQIAAFFNSNGETIIEPDGAGSLFETPAVAIPTDFGFIILR